MLAFLFLDPFLLSTRVMLGLAIIVYVTLYLSSGNLNVGDTSIDSCDSFHGYYSPTSSMSIKSLFGLLALLGLSLTNLFSD